MFAIVEKASGRWLGQAGPWKPVGWPGNEVGWSFHPDAWGNGYATEAATAAIGWAFDNLGWDRIIHCIHPENVSSQKLAARLGSRNSGPAPLPEPYQDSPNEVWTQTVEEWRARRAGATP
jgi:RimJ/RimL family protein N-acetyltransferase